MYSDRSGDLLKDQDVLLMSYPPVFTVSLVFSQARNGV